METIPTVEETRKKKIKRQNLAALAILVVGTALSFVLFGPKNDIQNEDTDNSIAKKVKVLELKPNETNRAILEKTVQFKAIDSSEAVAEYSGRIKQTDFEIGDLVSAGQVLAVFDQSDLSNSAKISFQSAQNSLELAEKNLKQAKDLAEESVDLAKDAVDLAEIQLDQAKDSGDNEAIELAEENLKMAENRKDQAEISAQSQINGAQIQVEQAKLGLNQAQVGYEKTFIKAPIGGYIVSKNIKEEDYVAAGFSVAQIAGKGELEGRVYLNQDEANRILVGDEVDAAFGSEIIKGRIASVSKVADQDNQRFEVVIRTAGELLTQANQFANVKFPLRLSDQEGFFIPLEAVNIGQKRNEVFIVRDGQVETREVETGKIIGRQIEVKRGLKVNEMVVIEGNRNLQSGEAVIID
jgi:multidrug efflux pump subunit AcrA (membrane-fusion protein)